MLLAEQAGKNIIVLFALGLAVLAAIDHAFYWLGYFVGYGGVRRLSRRFPRICRSILIAERTLRGRGQWTLVVGRFLPFLGRWVGLAAGITRVPYARFALLQLIGGGITVVGFGALAHFVGEKTFHEPWFPEALFYTFAGGTVFSILAAGFGFYLKRRRDAGVKRAA
jgi:membrane protein DedA with SNARE-associated domain